jgi:hypothetical protein
MDRLFEALITGLVSKPVAPVESPLDNLAKISELVKTLMPSGKESGRELDMYLRGREEGEKAGKALAALMSSGGDETQAIAQIGAPLIDLFKQQMERNNTPAPRADVRGAPHSQPPQLDMSPLWVQMLRPYKDLLLVRARAGKNPRVYAGSVVEDVPDHLLPRVAEALADRDFVGKFLSAFPEFNDSVELQQWVAEFVEEARELLRPDPDEIDGADGERAEVVNG